MRQRSVGGLAVAICGDILHSRVARSNIWLLNRMGARVRVVSPRTLLPAEIERLGVGIAMSIAVLLDFRSESRATFWVSAAPAHAG
jgi:aspartate carbamoyltransferase catalytic subunit